MKDHQLQLIALIASSPRRPLRGVEVGVAQGDTSEALLRAFSQLQLSLVDPWTTYPPGHSYRRSGDRCARVDSDRQTENMRLAGRRTEFARDRCRLIRLNSLSAADTFRDGSLDFVFVDADHTYPAVRTDLAAWFPKLRPGGLLCGHDYGHPRDRRGVWGVRKAVEEFAELHQLSVNLGDGTVWWVHRALE